MAGIIPGILMGLALVVVVMLEVRRNHVVPSNVEKASAKERWNAFKDAFWGFLMPVIILGGIYGGTVPATIWKNFMTEALKGTPAKDFDGSESSGGDSIGSLEDDKSTASSKKSAAPAKKEEKPAAKTKSEEKKQPGSQQPAAPQGQAPASAPASAGGGGGAAPEPGSSVSKGRN